VARRPLPAILTGLLARHARSSLACRAGSSLFATSPSVRRRFVESVSAHELLRLTRFVRRDPARTEATAAFASKLGLPGLAHWAYERLLSSGWNPDVGARFLETVRRLEDASSYLKLAARVRADAARSAWHPRLIYELAAARYAEGDAEGAIALARRLVSQEPDMTGARGLVDGLAPCRELEAGAGGCLGVLSCELASESRQDGVAHPLERLVLDCAATRAATHGTPRVGLVAMSRMCAHRSCALRGETPRPLLVNGPALRDPVGLRRSWRLPARLRPVFLSLAVDSIDDLTLDNRALLAGQAPIGCRDWRTVYLLSNLGVEAYHAGDPRRLSEMDGPARDLMRAVIHLAMESAATGMPAADFAALHRSLCAGAVEDARRRMERAPIVATPAPLGGIPTPGQIVAAGPLRGTVDVAVSFDERLLRVVPVMLESLVASTRSAIRLFCCVRGVSRRDARALASRFPEVDLRVIEMDGVDYGGTFHFYGQLTMSTMDRLLLPLLLPNLERMVSLDTDLVVLEDIEQLSACDVGTLGLAARPLVHPNWSPLHRLCEQIAGRAIDPAAADTVRLELSARVDFDARAFNAGVVVMDLERLRALRFSEETLDLSRRFGLHDNETMALWANGRFMPLADRWNYIPGIEHQEAPAIIHWAGMLKPWRQGEYVRHKEVWERAARAARRRRRARRSGGRDGEIGGRPHQPERD
jgi:lipopolysaccharide biosynthesis glycosyltransferase